MKYLMLITHDEAWRDRGIPQALMDAMGPWMEAKMKSGAVVDTAGLQASKHGRRVHSSAASLTVTDGPFTEGKELVGGFVMFEAPSLDAAVELTREFAELHRVHFPAFEMTCEVRPLEVFEADGA